MCGEWHENAPSHVHDDDCPSWRFRCPFSNHRRVFPLRLQLFNGFRGKLGRRQQRSMYNQNSVNILSNEAFCLKGMTKQWDQEAQHIEPSLL